MFLAKKLNRGAGTPVPVDAQFNYVTMLLHGDGTNGAQNNTFLDSGPNTLSITRNGNTTQGSFSPYGSNWSNYFDGNGDYLTAANNTDLDVGTGAFTIEGWIYRDGTGDADWRIIAGNTSNAGFFGGRGTLSLGFGRAAVAWDLESASNVYSLNTWTHVVYVRNGSGNLAIFANGTRVATTTNSNNYGLNGGLIEVGAEGANQYFGGYISNVRVVKGTAVYDPTASTLTVPTTPLTAVSGTGLLTCQSNRFVDNSSSPKTITVNGNTSVQRFNPFGTSTAYSTSVIGGSGYFDGTGDYLNTANSSAFAFGTGDFTVECWINTGSNNVGLAEVDGGSTGYWMWHINAGTMSWQNTRGGANLFLITGAGAVCDNAWHHLAIVRSSSVTKAYWDGVQKASASDTTNYSGTGGNLNVAYESAAGKILNGYMANFRIVKGTAVYTAAFTPPTAPLTAVTNTSILLNTVNAGIFDNAMMNNLETVGNAQISTSVKKYGTGSLAFDGTGDYLKSPDNLGIAFGSGNFTVEGWINLNNVTANQTKGIIYGLGNNSFGLRVGQSYLGNVNGLNISRSGVADLEYCAFTFSINTWYHIAVVRSGTTIYFFVNGTQQTTQGSGGSSYNFATPTSGFIFGANNDPSEFFNGYIDDFRITKGYARYTANFTAPTAEFLDIGPN